jgi:DNA-binding transcriptional ArsR family regulator
MGEAEYAFSGLDRLLHAPARLSIVTALYANKRGMTFSQLKHACRLSDGNLSRHVSRLETGLIVESQKKFVDRIPRTTFRLTAHGTARFEDYIDSIRRIINAQTESRDEMGSEFPGGVVYE